MRGTVVRNPTDTGAARGGLPQFLIDLDPDIYRSKNYVVLDFETTNKDKGSALHDDNRIVLACWLTVRGEKRSLHSRFASEFDLGELVRHCESADFLVAHNAKFELQWLERCGYDIGSRPVYDTMLAEYVLGGNRYNMAQLSLDKIAQRRKIEGKVGVVSALIKAGVPVEDIPAEWLEKYCKQDVLLTHTLYVQTLEELLDSERLPVLYTRCLLTPVLADIEKNGMQLDSTKVLPLLEEKEKEYEFLQRKLTREAGGINLNSPVQLGEFLYETLKLPVPKDRHGSELRTKTGRYPTSADTISSLRGKTKRQRDFLADYQHFRELNAELTKYLRKFGECCLQSGGAIRAAFNQSATRTHRLSSTGRQYSTQFQNLPRIYKPLFKARQDGGHMYEVDGSQLEFRVAVHLGRDKVGLEHIRAGVDVHSATARELGVPRQEAKSRTFKPLYGGSSGTPSEQRYYEYFKRTYSGIAGTQSGWVNTVLKEKELRTEWGLVFYWPDTKMTRSGYVTNTTSIYNYPVQSLATAEIIPVALVYMWHRVRAQALPFLLVNTIHDSIVAEGPESEEVKEQWHELAKQCLIHDVYYYMEKVYNLKLRVPLGCSVTNGSHWGSKDETKHEAPAELFEKNIV